jgi:hypothetical protein
MTDPRHADDPRHSDTTSPWTLSWETTQFGRAGGLCDVASAPPRVDGSRVTYHRPQFDEWYENWKQGIEQGFTIHDRPDGAGPLLLVGHLAGSVHAKLREGDGAVDFLDSNGACVLRYRNLLVRDANAREIPSRLAIDDGDLAILVEDERAVYPLTVDPLMDVPSWDATGNETGTEYGCSVATAGDVNGDGYSDVIVGADLYIPQASSVGQAFVYYGSSTGLSTTPNWMESGDQQNEHFATCVATAGDVNGDGYSDVIVGASLYDHGEADEGRAVVYLGSSNGLSHTIAWTTESNQAGAHLGASVASLGDVNGDGFSDVAVGAPTYDNGQADEGRAFVYYGSATGPAATASWIAESNQAGALFATTVAAAGDVNADNFSDFIIGAPLFHNGQSEEGRAFVYHGGSGGLAAAPSWTAEISLPGAHFGASVATAGDVNGDGFSDVVVGAPTSNNNDGEALVYHGSAGGLATTSAWTKRGLLNSGENLGASVATAGDVNGDGFADVIVGAPLWNLRFGAVYVYQGSQAGLASTNSWSWNGYDQNDQRGFSVATAGDVNGDGFSDVIVGAPFADGDGTRVNAGRASVFDGAGDGPSAAATWSKGGDQASAGFGVSVASAGDVNGDGFSDVIVGDNLFDNGQVDEGRAYVFEGSITGLATTPAWIVESNQAGAQFGYSVAGVGDVDGDGFADVIVGAPYFDHGETDEGRAFVYLGSASGLSTTAAWTAESDQADANFGISVASAGDVNGDGYSDAIIGAWAYDNGQINEGRAYAYQGSATGLAANPSWTAESDQVVTQFGISVASSGDVNGDGYSDVIVGAPRYDNGETDEGRVYSYHGSPTGLGASPARILESNVMTALFGTSVSTAGDVNGDGYSDIIIGAPGYSNGESGEGRIYVYRGLSSGVWLEPHWTKESDQADAALGRSVATAGDVNGDGYSDVIFGAWHYDDGESNEGEAVLFQGDPETIQHHAALWQAEGNQSSANFGISVAMAGDVNGDGYADIIVGANDYTAGQNDEGEAFVYYGNRGSTRPTLLTQRRTDNVTLIPPLGGSDSESQFRISARVLSVYGRTRLQLENEVKEFRQPFDGIGTVFGNFNDTGNDGQVNYGRLVTGLDAASRYHWRVRAKYDLVKTPFQRNGPWMTVPTNGAAEQDLFTPGDPTSEVANETSLGGSARFELQSAGANPSTGICATRLELGDEARVSAEVVDIEGRRIAVLARDTTFPAGSHLIIWNGCASNGKESPGGVYLIHVRVGDRSRIWRAVLVR